MEPRDLVVHHDAGEFHGRWQPEVIQRGWCHRLGACAGTAFVWGDLDLDASPGAAADLQADVEATWLDAALSTLLAMASS